MKCPLCDHPKAHKHGVTTKGTQRYRCPICRQSFTETSDTLYYLRQISPHTIAQVLQSHAEGCSYRGIARIHGIAYETVISLIHKASERAQQLLNQEVQKISTEQVLADEMWSFVKKNKSNVLL